MLTKTLPYYDMKHSGRARKAAFKLILFSLITIAIILAIGIIAILAGTAIVTVWPLFVGLWVLFAAFTLYFFRDPDAKVPTGPNLVVSPGHGKIDVIDTTTEP